MIKKMTRALVRLYTDSGQVQAQVGWVDSHGEMGTTVGHPANPHIQALLARAKREGIQPRAERW